MIACTVRVNLKKQEVVMEFMGETNTFLYDEASAFTCEDALRVSMEVFHRQILELLRGVLEKVESDDDQGGHRA